MEINIYGSTGEIGSKSLYLIDKYFPNFKINLLIANKNYRKLIKQVNLYKPKYISINDVSKIKFIKKQININKTKIIYPNEIEEFLLETKSHLSLLAISGFESLNYLNSIFKNTKILGLVNKESIVSSGHLFKKLKKKYDVDIYPLDSEHFSLIPYYNAYNKKKFLNNQIRKVYLSSSGGPFFKTKLNLFSKISFKSAIAHPKWKMGYKNSIDSATLANKCLEVIEAHYLFDIPYNLLDIFIHPQALIHSVIEFDNYTSNLNYFFPDMLIPIYNFFRYCSKTKIYLKEKNDLMFNKTSKLDFFEVDEIRYPIYKIFNSLHKDSPSEIIKFNTANEIAVDKFKNGKIKFNEIHEFVDFALSLDFTHKTNSINNIMCFQKYFINKLQYENFKN